jgi:hypothetical protein
MKKALSLKMLAIGSIGLTIAIGMLPFSPVALAETVARAQGRCKLSTDGDVDFDGHCTVKQKQNGDQMAFVVELDNGMDYRFSGPNRQALQIETHNGMHNAQFQDGTDRGVFTWQEDGDRRKLSVKLDTQQSTKVSHDDAKPTSIGAVIAGAAVGALIGALLAPKGSSSPDPKSLDPVLKTAVEQVIGPDMQTQGVKVEDQQLFVGYADLNGDRLQDAIVIMSSSYWCGTGGCTMFVFEGRDQAFSLVSRSTLVRPPLTVSKTKTNGWQDLILEVSGGGMPSKTVALKFDGKQYPLNPSDQPSLPENTPIQGKVLFPEGSKPRTVAELASP